MACAVYKEFTNSTNADLFSTCSPSTPRGVLGMECVCHTCQYLLPVSPARDRSMHEGAKTVCAVHQCVRVSAGVRWNSG